jgi:hypothetical protein
MRNTELAVGDICTTVGIQAVQRAVSIPSGCCAPRMNASSDVVCGWEDGPVFEIATEHVHVGKRLETDNEGFGMFDSEGKSCVVVFNDGVCGLL